ncbi:transposase [Microvirga massiliensis]
MDASPYACDLTDAEWARLAPLIPAAIRLGGTRPIPSDASST